MDAVDAATRRLGVADPGRFFGERNREMDNKATELEWLQWFKALPDGYGDEDES